LRSTTRFHNSRRVAVVGVVVGQGGQQIVRQTHRVEVSREVEVDVLHRDDLRMAAAGGPSFGPEARPERWLAQADDRFPADRIEAVAEADRRRGLALARGRRTEAGDEHELSVRPAGERVDDVEGKLGLVVAIGFDACTVEAESFRDQVRDPRQRCLARDIKVGHMALRSTLNTHGVWNLSQTSDLTRLFTVTLRSNPRVLPRRHGDTKIESARCQAQRVARRPASPAVTRCRRKPGPPTRQPRWGGKRRRRRVQLRVSVSLWLNSDRCAFREHRFARTTRDRSIRTLTILQALAFLKLRR
jgi:hypothetical protein